MIGTRREDDIVLVPPGLGQQGLPGQRHGRRRRGHIGESDGVQDCQFGLILGGERDCGGRCADRRQQFGERRLAHLE